MEILNWNVTHANLTMTWDATSDNTKTLGLSFWTEVTNETDGSKSEVLISDWINGTSPLTFSSTVNETGDNQPIMLYVVVRSTVAVNEDVWAKFHPEQPFTVTGTLTVKPDKPK